MGGNISTEILLKAVAGVYEAALDTELWPQIVNGIADMIGAESTHLMAVETGTGTDPLGFLERQDPAAHRDYMENFLPHDIRVPRLATSRVGKIIRDQDVWTPEEKLSSPLYQDYQRVHKLYEITGAQLGIEGHLTWLGFSRKTQSPFEGAELRAIELLIPHVRQAVRISLELRARELSTLALGDMWSLSGRGVVILAPDGTIWYSNNEAEAMCLAGRIRMSGKRLSFRENAVNGLLAVNLMALREGRPPSASPAAGMTTSVDGEQTGIRFMPLTSGSGAAPHGACLLVMLTPLSTQPRASAAEISQFGSLFALTPSEQRVLTAASNGVELAAHARERGVSVDTVRQQMKAILGKTNCRSQKGLLRLVERFCFLQLR